MHSPWGDMGDPIIEYQSRITLPRSWKQRTASVLNTITWTLCALSFVGIAMIAMSRPSHVPYEVGSYSSAICNLAGAPIAIGGAALGNAWCWMAIIAHLIAFVLAPSFYRL